MIFQPYNQVVWPSAATVTPAQSMGIPALARCVGIVSGLIRQMSIDAYRGSMKQPRTRFLNQPDPTPNANRAWWVGQHVEDYLVHGNAVHLVTVRDAAGWPLAATWVPASWVTLTTTPDGHVDYWVQGRHVPAADVVHVRRRADSMQPARGIGVVEQHIATFDRLDKQARYETAALDQSGVPSVVIIAPNADLSQEQADSASSRWMEKFTERKPAVLPAGTTVTPLAWSPADAQMVEARKLSLQDVANLMNLDGYWTGAPSPGLTYKSVGPLFLNLVRQTTGPITDDLEQVWGNAWLPYGQELRFATREILADDMATDVAWITSAIDAKLMTVEQGQEWLGFERTPA